MRGKIGLISSVVTFFITFGLGWHYYSVNSFWGFFLLVFLSYIVSLIVSSIFDGSFGGGSNGDHFGGSGGHLG